MNERHHFFMGYRFGIFNYATEALGGRTAAVDADGRFESTGEHIRGRGAAPRPGELPDRHPAHYAGRIRGDVMTLTVLLTDIDQTVGTFEVGRGKTPDLVPCP